MPVTHDTCPELLFPVTFHVVVLLIASSMKIVKLRFFGICAVVTMLWYA
uniref:Uncharacterized protein n=1 Tax=Arundo donax TaxID=35708 RepID=A0A0A9D8D5_ARUDO